MSCRWRLIGLGLGLTLAACSADDPPVTAPSLPPRGIAPVEPTATPMPVDQDRARNQRLALRLAQALRNQDFRNLVLGAVSASPFREQKVHLQAFFNANRGAARRAAAELSGAGEAALAADLGAAGPLELYFPVASHRQRWLGGPDLLIATAEADHEAPVAFDLMGRELRLDPDTPPVTPVLMLGRAENRFDAPPSALSCIDGCGSLSQTPGLYLTRTAFTGTFEGWFKGDPEFEVHVLGKDPLASRLKTYQCAGEYAGGGYAFDQNGTTWSGNALLFSQSQLDQYKLQYPGQNLRILVVEDDDTACEIRVDSTRVERMLQQIDAAYSGLAGGKDSTLSLGKVFRKANMLYKLLAAVANWFKTNDDPVGNAVEDPNAAASFFAGANWVVKGENTVTNGALRLEMR